MAVYEQTYDELLSLIEATFGSSVANDQVRIQNLVNLAASRAKKACDYWERMLVIGEPRRVVRGYLDEDEDSFHVYGAGTSAVNGLYTASGDDYIKTTSDGTTEYTLEPFVDAMVVEGAGSAAANGVYLRDGDSGGLPRYTIHGGTTDEDSIVGDDGVDSGAPPQWGIFSGGSNRYAALVSASTPDLVETWDVVLGTAPAPTVRRATLSDTGITADYVTWRIVDSEGNVVYSNPATQLTPPLTGWVVGTGTAPTPALKDLETIETPLYWQKYDPADHESRTFEFQSSTYGLRPYGNREDNGIVYVTYIKRLTDKYGDGTGGTTTSIPAEWFDYISLYVTYMMQSANRMDNPSPAYTIALREVNASLEDSMMRAEASGMAQTIRQNIETRIAYSSTL